MTDYLFLSVLFVVLIIHILLRYGKSKPLGISANKPVYENYLFWWFLVVPLAIGIMLLNSNNSSFVLLLNEIALADYSKSQLGITFCGLSIPTALLFLKLHANAIASQKFDNDRNKDSNADFQAFFSGVERRFEILQITSFPKLKEFLFTIDKMEDVWEVPPCVKCDECRKFVYGNTNFLSVVKQLHFINNLIENDEDGTFGRKLKCYFAQLRGMLMVSGVDASEFKARLIGMDDDKFRIVVGNQEDWRKFNVDFAFLVREAISYFGFEKVKLIELYDAENDSSLPISIGSEGVMIVRLPHKPKLNFEISDYFTSYIKKIG